MANKYSEYKGLKIGKEAVAPVTEQELTDALNSLLARSTTLEEVEKTSEEGDTVNIDFEGFVDGVAFQGGKGDAYDLELGSHTFIPGFEDQLVGKNKGEEVEVKVTFPTEYTPELAGKDAIFKCKVNSVKQKKEAVLDDEFALLNGAKDVEDLRNQIKKEIEYRNEQKSINTYFDKICAHLIENSEIEVSKDEEEKSLQNVLAYYNQMVGQYGMNLDQYLEMAKKTMDDFKAMIQPDVIRGAKINTILAYIAEEEKFEVSEEVVEGELNKIREYYHLNDEQLKEFKDRNLGDFKQELVKRMVFEFLVKNND